MNPIEQFHPKQVTYHGGREDIGNLAVVRVQYDIGPALVSCWRPTIKERIKLLLGWPVFLCIMGHVQPPVLLTADSREVLGDDDEEVVTW